MGAAAAAVVAGMILLSTAGCGSSSPAASAAANYPAKPITIIVALPPGSGTDVEIRGMQKSLSQSLHTSIIIKNIAGGGTAPALEAMESKPADGYTVLATTISTEFVLAKKLTPYKRKNAIFLAQFAAPPMGLWVLKSSPYRTLGDLMAYAKTHPKKVTLTGVGPLSPNTVEWAFLQKHYGVKLTYVPSPGGNDTVTQVLGHHSVAGTSTVLNVVPYAGAGGKLRVLWVAQDTPVKALASVRTSKQLGLNFTFPVWFGFMMKSGTPTSIQNKLISAIQKATETSTFVNLVRKRGGQVAFLGEKPFTAEVNGEWTRITNFLATYKSK